MHRIDCPTATPDNRFTEGDPTIPVAATTVTADWLNAVQEELVAPILAADMELDKTKTSQLLEAILALVAKRAPLATTARPGLVQVGNGLGITEEGLLFAVGAGFATCATPGATAAKQVSLGAQPTPGTRLYLVFDEVNTAAAPTLTVDDGPAKPLLWQGVPPEVGNLAKGQIYGLMYSGTSWQILSGMAPWGICQTRWFEDTLARPGFVPLNGGIVANFAATWPQAMAYLQTSHGQARCFASLDEREAAHVAIWHTLASGATVGWEGVGGLTKFFYDPVTDQLYLPDLRGMFRAVAGDGIVAPSMGEAAGDGTRNIFTNRSGDCRAGDSSEWIDLRPDGAGYFPSDKKYAITSSMGNYIYITHVGLDGSRIVPTGAVNLPRSWAALASVYLGQPATV